MYNTSIAKDVDCLNICHVIEFYERLYNPNPSEGKRLPASKRGILNVMPIYIVLGCLPGIKEKC